MLRVYVASDCPGSERARLLVRRLQGLRPDLPVELIDVDTPGSHVPEAVFGTPTYTWNNKIIFLGNPSETTLLEFEMN